MVDNFITVKLKLERFIKKYYVNELIRGLILFAAIGLLYFLFTLLIEYILWLKPVARTLLFWVFVIVELSLFIKLIISPTFKLLKLKQGLNYIEASRIVGEFFPEVKDKLINVIQLHNTKDRSELLLASIQQKSLELKPVPFSIAVNFSHNVKYLKYLAIPLLIVTLSFISGHMNWFSDSYNRVVNYQTAYDPPAPFRFLITNQNLNAIENNPFKLVVTTSGNVVPEDVQIFYQGEAYFLKQSRTNEFEYVFSKPQQPLDFIVSANGVFSETYRLNVIAAPTILGFEMVLNYPAYTKKKDESFSNNGNASVPQGTKITWNVRTKSTTQLRLVTDDSVFSFLNDNDNFKISQRVHNNLKYLINTSNESLENYESLAFSINILKDELPRLKVEMNRDSVELETLYFYGQASDDYGLNKLELIYYQTDTPENKFIKSIPIKQTNFDEFIYIFPNNLDLDNNVSYELYFKIYDNDIINGYKSVKSELFRYRKRSVKELALEKLNNQKATITVHGNVGTGVAENMMSGKIVVKGNASQSAGATGHGGALIIEGDASSRCGISMKGIDIVVKGSVGHMSAFMAQKGNLVVMGDADADLGDSIYEAKIFVKGKVKSLGADCVEKKMDKKNIGELTKLFKKLNISEDPKKFKRYGSARNLYNFKIDNVGAY